MASGRSTGRRSRGGVGLVLLALVAPQVYARPAGADEIRTVVVGLQARRNVDEGLALAMSDVVQGELLTDKTRKVFGRTDLQRVLEFESERQALGCVDDSCLAEIASALDVDRIITGSMDKVGSSYFVVITEIDAQKVEPLGRVQKRLPLNEDQLITGIQQMTRELLRTTSSGGSGAVSAAVIDKGAPPRKDDDEPPTTASVDARAAATAAAAGVVVVTTDPPGREVFLGDKVVGQTPLRLEDVPVGTAELRVRLDEGDPVFVDVPVTSGGATEVNAKIGVMASDAEYDAYDDAVSSWETWMYVKLGLAAAAILLAAPLCGIVGMVVVAGIAISAGMGVWAELGAVGCGVFGLLPCLGGLGLGGWGLYDYVNEPDAPVALDGPVHRVEVLPPDSEAIRFDVEAERAEDAVEEPVAPKRKKPKGSQDDAPEAYRDDEADGEEARDEEPRDEDRRDEEPRDEEPRDERDEGHEDDDGYDEEEEEEQGFRPRAQQLPTGPRLAGDAYRF